MTQRGLRRFREKRPASPLLSSCTNPGSNIQVKRLNGLAGCRTARKSRGGEGRARSHCQGKAHGLASIDDVGALGDYSNTSEKLREYKT